MTYKAFNPHTLVFVDGKDTKEKRRMVRTLNLALKKMGVKSELYNNGDVYSPKTYGPGELVDFLNNLSRDNLRDLTHFLSLYKVEERMLENRTYIKQIRPQLKNYLIINREIYEGLYTRAKYLTNADLTAGLTAEEGKKLENACEMCRPIFANLHPVVSVNGSEDDMLIESRTQFLMEAASKIHYGRTSDKRTISTNGEFMTLYRRNADDSLDFVGGHFARYNIN